MNDLTVIHYTANRIPDHFAESVRANILQVAGDIPIISVSHKPLSFGKNICIGVWPPSAYMTYQQVLIAAMFAETKYVVCCEDDSLYVPEHFTKRPSEGKFAYNIHRWNVDSTPLYYYRSRCGMCMCIAERDLLVQTLCQRFTKFPRVLPREQLAAFGEPGRKDALFGLPQPPLEIFTTEIPCLTFNHRNSMGGKRKLLRNDKICDTLPFWGPASELWQKIHG